MNPHNGRIQEFGNAAAAVAAGFVPIRRDLTVKKRADKQIRMYAPCGCGSGRKFKFCCRAKVLG